MEPSLSTKPQRMSGLPAGRFDNMMVTSISSVIVQETHYDPWGLEMTGLGFQYGGIKVNKYLYQGKEMVDDYSLNIYDFHARGYDAAIGRTLQQDPHAGTYFELSPYSFVGNNPVKYIDPNGKDYRLAFNHENKTITISATLYTTSKDNEEANSSAEKINSQGRQFSVTVGEGENASSYTVNFDVNVVEVEVDSKIGAMGTLNQALSNDKSGAGNIFTSVNDSKLGENTNGTTTGGNFIQIKESRAGTGTGAHEIGHAIGLTHSTKGLMTPSNNNAKRNMELILGDVKDIIMMPLRNKVNSENGNKAGQGNIVNTTPIINSSNDYTPEGFNRTFYNNNNFRKGKFRKND